MFRANTMKVIVNLFDELSEFIPGHIGRYSDDFEPRAFGDNMVKWGTSSVLIESGGWKDDTEKQFIRKLNFVAILTALQSIANKYYVSADIARYEQIPENETLLFNSLFKNLKIKYSGNPYIIDVGVNVNEKSIKDSSAYYFEGKIDDIGDLSVFYGYDEFDCSGMEIFPGKVYPETFTSLEAIFKMDIENLLDQGFTYIKLESESIDDHFFNLPINLVVNQPDFEPTFRLNSEANFILRKDENIRFVVVNGFVYDPVSKSNNIKNGLILK